MKLICYNYLPSLANYVIDLPIDNYLSIGITPLHNYPVLNVNELKNGDKIFVKTDFLKNFLSSILPNIQTKFYLITGVSDYEIDDSYLSYVSNDKIIQWIGVNISIQNNPKISKFLIGFQEPDRRRYGTAEGEGGDQELIYNMYTIKNNFIDKKDKLFIPYFSNTHSSRGNITTIFNSLSYVVFGNKTDFETYLKNINDYKFVLCPRGNGLDTHRFCEILIMGSVPIVEKNGLYDLYENFPCIIINNYSEITYELLSNYEFDINKYTMFEKYIFTHKNYLNISIK